MAAPVRPARLPAIKSAGRHVVVELAAGDARRAQVEDAAAVTEAGAPHDLIALEKTVRNSQCGASQIDDAAAHARKCRVAQGFIFDTVMFDKLRFPS